MIKIDFVAFAGKFKTTIHTSNTFQRTVVNVNTKYNSNKEKNKISKQKRK